MIDRKTGKLVKCDKTLCPYMDDKGINHAPFASFGGWSGAINAGSDAKKKDAEFKASVAAALKEHARTKTSGSPSRA